MDITIEQFDALSYAIRQLIPSATFEEDDENGQALIIRTDLFVLPRQNGGDTETPEGADSPLQAMRARMADLELDDEDE